MHFKLAFPSEYISAADLAGKEVAVTMSKVEFAPVKMKDGREQKKLILHFAGKQKKMVLNKTNATQIAHQHGNETDTWSGKIIHIFPTTCQAFGEEVECIRVK